MELKARRGYFADWTLDPPGGWSPPSGAASQNPLHQDRIKLFQHAVAGVAPVTRSRRESRYHPTDVVKVEKVTN